MSSYPPKSRIILAMLSLEAIPLSWLPWLFIIRFQTPFPNSQRRSQKLIWNTDTDGRLEDPDGPAMITFGVEFVISATSK